MVMSSKNNRPQSVVDLFNHIERGEKAQQLLSEIWYELDMPYSNILSDKLNREMRKFFEFDDSE